MAGFSNSFFQMIHEEDDNHNDFELLANVVINDVQRALRRRSKQHGGSIVGHNIIYRERVSGHDRLFRDYFAGEPTYPAKLFRRRFRMSRDLFCRIQTAVEVHDPYFVQRTDATGLVGLSPLQKVTAVMRMLAYGASADSVDDYVRIGESTAIESLKRFVRAVVEVFGDLYLRSPNGNDIIRLVAQNEQRGFPGMLGSIDCMHWKWKNCPTSWHGMYSGHIHEPTLILEVVASRDCWIWHAFFGMSGSFNDINVLGRSPLFAELVEGRAPPVNYFVNGHNYDMGYYLADGIYPTYATFVKTIPCPQGPKNKHFAKKQEAAWKDVERAFGILQARFAIVRGPARFWDEETLKYIMTACIIMHNMIIEDEGDPEEGNMFDNIEEIVTATVSRNHNDPDMAEFFQNRHRIQDKKIHSKLQTDLIEHLWKRLGDGVVD